MSFWSDEFWAEGFWAAGFWSGEEGPPVGTAWREVVRLESYMAPVVIVASPIEA